MLGNQPRRKLLKTIGATVGAGSGPFSGIALARESNNEISGHSIPYDLQVINNGRSGRNIRIEFVQVESGKEEEEQVHEFDIAPLNESEDGRSQNGALPETPPVANSGLDLAGGTYKVMANGPTGESYESTLAVPPGGLPDHHAIIVSRKPDHRITVSHTVI